MFVIGCDVWFETLKNQEEVLGTFKAWRKLVIDPKTSWSNLQQVKEFDSKVRFITPYTVFRLRGEEYKIMAEINYKSSIVSVRSVVSKSVFETRYANILKGI